MGAQDDDKLADALRQAAILDRGYASYWSWPLDRPIEEHGVVNALLNYLLVLRPELRGTLASASIGDDPPDVILTCENGKRIGIEVTELVHSGAIQAVVNEKRSGKPSTHIYAHWSPSAVADALSQRISSKDKKLLAKRGDFDELILAIFTDEIMISQDVAIQAIQRVCHDTDAISSSYFLLSYHPETDPKAFPDKCPIFQINPPMPPP